MVAFSQKMDFQSISDFKDITYLKNGNAKQRLAYHALIEATVFETLSSFNPVLAGTIPLGIDLETSDLDIICEVNNFDEFKSILIKKYGSLTGFSCYETKIRNEESVIAKFYSSGFEFEVFGQSKPILQQYAVIHMLVEARLLKLSGKTAKAKIHALKANGLKTEPAFAAYFKIDGDSYDELAKLHQFTDAEIKKCLKL